MSPPQIKFIVDQNVGKLVKWLRLMGFDTEFFDSGDDHRLVGRALAENRTILTRDTGIARRRLVTQGRLKVLLLATGEPEIQMRQVVSSLDLPKMARPFTRCLEDNRLLAAVGKDLVKELVPPYVFKTQEQYMRCPACGRIYWRGTHWQAMLRKLKAFVGDAGSERHK